jgi:GntR family transcriptional repressor for pyruvate dehydrogenase complex
VMMQAHSLFHSAVAKATANPLFELVTRPLYHVSYGEEVVENLPEGYWMQIDADHRELLDCLRRRDPDGATAVARRHLDYIVWANAR